MKTDFSIIGLAENEIMILSEEINCWIIINHTVSMSNSTLSDREAISRSGEFSG